MWVATLAHDHVVFLWRVRPPTQEEAIRPWVVAVIPSGDAWLAIRNLAGTAAILEISLFELIGCVDGDPLWTEPTDAERVV